MSDSECLQERFAPNNACFGCGPKNDKGLRLRSFPDTKDQDVCIAEWKPESHHEAFPGILNGGIIGALLDCHSNWTAAWTLMKAANETNEAPSTVTAHFKVSLLKPTPSDRPVIIKARCSELKAPNKAFITAELTVNGDTTATCEGLFVAVKEGHPAYHRWN